MSGEDTAARVAQLEAWVEVVMRTLATLGLGQHRRGGQADTPGPGGAAA